MAALKEVFSDPLLNGELPGDQELIEISDAAPNAATGVIKLYRAYREQAERLSDLSELLAQGWPRDRRCRRRACRWTKCARCSSAAPTILPRIEGEAEASPA